jgi:hypothetical protein
MSNIKDGGPAFPTNEERFPDGEMNHEATYGMTLRDYFAAKVLQGTLASLVEGQDWYLEMGSEWCYKVADAMLKAREVQP